MCGVVCTLCCGVVCSVVLCGVVRLDMRKTPPCVDSKRLRVCVQDASVCTGKTPACPTSFWRRWYHCPHPSSATFHTSFFSSIHPLQSHPRSQDRPSANFSMHVPHRVLLREPQKTCRSQQYPTSLTISPMATPSATMPCPRFHLNSISPVPSSIRRYPTILTHIYLTRPNANATT